jgi:threonine dehydratase
MPVKLNSQRQREGLEEVMAKYAPNSVHVPSSDHPYIIAGQGTVAWELLEQVRSTHPWLFIRDFRLDLVHLVPLIHTYLSYIRTYNSA